MRIIIAPTTSTVARSSLPSKAKAWLLAINAMNHNSRKFCKMFPKKFAELKICRIFAIPKHENSFGEVRELSSVGSERLPYKQRVGGSTPSAPTKSSAVTCWTFFVHVPT